ncbi:MAG: PEP-CTERM sorting domain-containing protein [Kiritimatiellia bacterium]
MKKILAFALVAMLAGSSFGAWGLWASDGSFSSTTIDGVTQSLAAFDSYDFGTFDLTMDSMIFSLVSVNTFKNDTSDVMDANYYYTIYTGSRPVTPTFTQIDGGWLADLGGGDQTWGASGLSIDLLDYAGLVAGTTYTLEIYGEVNGDDDTGASAPYFQYDNNNAAPANYTATFSTAPIPEPATMSLLGLGALAMVLRRKMSK